MANIRQNEAPQGIGLNPTETGIEAVAGAARRIGTFYNQTADLYGQEGSELKSTITDVGSVAENYMTHRDISAGAANGAQFIAQKNDQWNEIAKTADPNDVTIKQKFIDENLNPALNQFKGGFSTERSQQWAEHFVDQYRSHMSEKTSADMSTLAGIAVRKNVATTVNALSSAVASDPSSLDFALKSVDHSIGATVASSPNISATDAAAVTSEVGLKAKESIVKSAISGMIQKNPNIDLDAIQKKYGNYINGAEMKMFQKAAQTQAKADLLTQKSLETYQRKEQETAVAKNLSKVWTDSVSYDGDNRPVVKPGTINALLDIERKYPGVDSAAVSARIENVRHSLQQREEAIITNPKVQADLLANMTNPDPKLRTDETKILQAANENRLSPHATSNLLALRKSYDDAPIKDPVFHQVFGAAKSIMEQALDGQERFGKFAFQFMTEYQRLSRAGQLKPDDLDMSKPDSMISKMMDGAGKPTISDRAQYHLFKNLGANPADIDFSGMGGKPKAPTITTKEQFDGLASGATYTGSDGKTYRKP